MENSNNYAQPQWIDSHVHLDADAYQEDLDSVIQNAFDNGVTEAILPSLNFDSANAIQKLHAQYPQLHPTAGIHPHEAKLYDPNTFESQLSHFQNKIVAVGETGIEGHYDFVPQKQQRESFEHHLGLSNRYQLPIIVHCRESEQIVFEALKPYAGKISGVIHCFTGSWEWAKKFLDLGFHIGITGVVTFKKATLVHEVAQKTPLNRLLVETDGPYLAPNPFRGKRNQPAYIPYIGEAIARLRQEPVAKIATQTKENTRTLFNFFSSEQNLR